MSGKVKRAPKGVKKKKKKKGRRSRKHVPYMGSYGADSSNSDADEADAGQAELKASSDTQPVPTRPAPAAPGPPSVSSPKNSSSMVDRFQLAMRVNAARAHKAKRAAGTGANGLASARRHKHNRKPSAIVKNAKNPYGMKVGGSWPHKRLEGTVPQSSLASSAATSSMFYSPSKKHGVAGGSLRKSSGRRRKDMGALKETSGTADQNADDRKQRHRAITERVLRRRTQSWSGSFVTFVPSVKNFQVGKYVRIATGRMAGATGVIAFIGPVKFASGHWVGVALDNPVPHRGDGVKHGVRYFSCAPGHAAFVKAAMLRPVTFTTGVPTIPESETASSLPSRARPKRLPFRARRARGGACSTNAAPAAVAGSSPAPSNTGFKAKTDASAEEKEKMADEQQTSDEEDKKELQQTEPKSPPPPPPPPASTGPPADTISPSSSAASVPPPVRRTASVDSLASVDADVAPSAAAALAADLAELSLQDEKEEPHLDASTDDGDDAAEFVWACEDGKLEDAKQYIAQHPDWINFADQEGETALHKACRHGHADTVAFLLSKDIDVDAVDDDGRTALLLATMSGHSKLIELLLGASANPNIRDNLGNFPLVACAGWSPNPTECLKALLKSPALDFHLTDKQGLTALTWAVKGGRADLIRLMQIALHHARCRRAFMLGLVRQSSPVFNSFAACAHFQVDLITDIFSMAGLQAGQESDILAQADALSDSDSDDGSDYEDYDD